MKIFKILLCMVFILALSSCHKKDSVYDYPDDEPVPAKGEVGDPCERNIDCKDGLLCIDKVCSEPAGDEDSTDNDDSDKDDTDTEDDSDSDTDTKDDDDTDSGNDDSDTQPQDDTDTGINDNDEKEDADTMPDDDIEPYVPGCGNGIKDEGEECDNGLDNSDDPGITGITCRTNCVQARCGDNILDNGELCDDGNNADGDYCRADCQGITGYCGDGILQTNEVCDTRNNPYCAEDCQSTTGACGDGIKQSFEVCDTADPSEGNHEGIGAYCTNCTEKSGRCGDAIIQHGIEDCDDGDLLNGTYGHCGSKCKGSSPHCGDGILQRSNCNGYGSNCVVFAGASEVCDDGNYEDGDYCSADCQTSFGSCGDGTIQEGLEVCDKAKPGVGEGQGIGAYCSDNCQEIFGRCGDETVQEGIEECDYGDGKNGVMECPYNTFVQCEVCTLNCQKATGRIVYCGDGIVQNNEECDKATTGAGIGPHYCSSDCKQIIGRCGDGIIQENEVCDPAKADDPNSPYCSADCKQINGRCGDGTVNGKEGHEECDNGENGTNPNGNTKCAYGETSCEVCTVDCKKATGTETSYCGNGGVDASNGEQCDDRQNNGKYSPYATSASTAYCNSDCKGRGEGGFCGDGTMQRANCGGFDNCTVAEGANETCDEGTNNGKTACDYGETSCTVCTISCSQTAGTEISYCGDGKIDSSNGEVCDKADPSVGNHQGIGAYCSDDCRTRIGSCGDGTKQENEVCDKAEPSIGNHQGIGIYCSDDCQTKFGECGDGTRNQDNNGNWLETCDDGTANNGHYKHDAPGYCNENCKGYGEGGYCGDSTKQDEEECEHSGNIQIYCPYGQESCQVCSSDCTWKAGKTAKCNDGIIQREDCTGYANCVVTAGADEVCDDGENNGKYGGFCNATCSGITPHCNDGILQRADCTGYANCVVFAGANEECDDGEYNGQYRHDAPGYCNTGCNGRGNGGYCGDHIKNGSEKCDDPDGLNGTYGHCNGDCSGDSPKCGDKIIHRADCTGYDNCVEFAGSNEECDDGDGINGNYNQCNANCTAQLKCGDGILQREDCEGYGENCVVLEGANEECDDGDDNGGYEKCNTTCSGYNEGGYCGDGKVQREDCDGYTLCDESTTENCCVVTEGANEMCDGGDNNGHYSVEAPGHCNANCDGFAEGGTCGDRKVQKATSEACSAWVAEDPGNRSLCEGDTTEDCCEVAEGADENCDEGTDNGQYGHCNSTCSSVSLCNDGIIQRPDCTGYANCIEMEGADESCDDGLLVNGTYGSNCNETCDGYTGYCNDGIIQRANCTGYDNCVVTSDANEECDDNVFYNGTYGHCNSECTAKRTERCGDGKVQKATSAECTAWVDEDQGNRSLCDESTTENCCEVVKGADENCDEGDGVNGSFGHCDNNCKVVINYRCGDGKLQKDRLEDCGDMDRCDENTTENCCEVVVFAEGDSPETCDEGALNGTQEHCDLTCSGLTPYCGDGITQRADCTGYKNCRVVEGMNEECDDAGSNGHYGRCNATCSGLGTERCGDGTIHRESCTGYTNCVEIPGADENCDDGSDNGKYYGHCDDKCLSTTWNGYCGDGTVQMASDAECTAFVEATGADPKLCKVVAFKPGDPSEACDEGDNNGYHDHCNTTCDGTSSCGDGVVGKDELCEPGTMEEPWPCNMLTQFGEDATGTVSECNNECMPIFTDCTYTASYTSPVFTTGQTKCYNNSVEITCPSLDNEDFYGQEPNFNYTAHDFETIAGGAVIKENVSGLMWQADTPDYYGFEKDIDYIVYSCTEPDACTFNEARNYCSDSYIGAYNNWRLPTAAELATIVDHSDSNHIYSSFFTNTTGSYWTKDGLLFSSSEGTFSVADPSTPAQIKCVRSNEAHCPLCNHDFFVSDLGDMLLTALDEEEFIFWNIEDLTTKVAWEDALTFCKETDNYGINKMRLPTVNELILLFDGENGGSLISGFNKKVWTSTTFNNDPTQAYVLDFSTGSVTYEPKTNSNIVICVE